MKRRWLVMVGIVLVAALLAFPLRDSIQASIVVPMAYILWGLGVLYRVLSQLVSLRRYACFP